MPSLGDSHVCLLCSDGTAVAFGWNGYGQCNISPAPQGTSYVEVASGGTFTILLCSDGQAVLNRVRAVDTGCPRLEPASLFTRGHIPGGLSIPALPMGMAYKQVAAGHGHFVALRSDGKAVAQSGTMFNYGQTRISPLSNIVQVAAGHYHTVLLDSQGQAQGFGRNTYGQCDLPPAGPGQRWTEVRASASSTALMRSDGQVCFFGDVVNYVGAVSYANGVVYIDVAMGFDHALLLISDGTVKAVGSNHFGQCQVPPLPNGVYYTEIAAKAFASMLLRSDGTVLFCGRCDSIQSDLPSILLRQDYVPARASRDYVVQLHVSPFGNLTTGGSWPQAICRGVQGDLLAQWPIACYRVKVYGDVQAHIPVSCCRLRIVICGHGLLSSDSAWCQLLLD